MASTTDATGTEEVSTVNPESNQNVAEGGEAEQACSASTSPVESPPARRARTFSMSEDGSRVIVMAVDASEDAKFAFEWFLSNIYKEADTLILVHCPEAPHLPTFSFKSPIAPPIHEWKTIMDDLNDKTRKLEEDYELICIQGKLRYKLRGEAMKNPGEGIIKIAEEELAEMIIMGSRGVGKMRRAIVGSVSDYVVRNALLPVILVPSIKKQEKRRKSQHTLLD